MFCFLLAFLLPLAAKALTQREADGLVRYGYCTGVSASQDCSWTPRCSGVTCISNPFTTTPSGDIGLLFYNPRDDSPVTFAGISADFLSYFENVTTLIVDDNQLSNPVRWNLNSRVGRMTKLGSLIIRSRPGGLYGRLPERFSTRKPFLLSINGSVEGTLPAAWMENINFQTLVINNHMLVGTIPEAWQSHYFSLFDVSSETGNLVGDYPDTASCTLSERYSTGPGNNGGLFCRCSTSCTPNSNTGENTCYSYTDPAQIIDGCAAVGNLPNCANTKLTLRYGTLCYDVCNNGCATGESCQVVFIDGVPQFDCVVDVIDTITTSSTLFSSSSADSALIHASAILLTLLL